MNIFILFGLFGLTLLVGVTEVTGMTEVTGVSPSVESVKEEEKVEEKKIEEERVEEEVEEEVEAKEEVKEEVIVEEKKITTTYTYFISVKIKERRLTLFGATDGGERIQMVTYPVAVPRKKYYGLPCKGTIIEIVLNPSWYPTPKTRQDYLNKGAKLPLVVKPGPSNPMGAAKFIIQFDPPMDRPIRVHGTNEPETIGTPATRGCIRMYNKDILELAKIIESNPTEIIIE